MNLKDTYIINEVAKMTGFIRINVGGEQISIPGPVVVELKENTSNRTTAYYIRT